MKTVKSEVAAPMDFDRWMRQQGPKDKPAPTPQPTSPSGDPTYDADLQAEKEAEEREDDLVLTVQKQMQDRGYTANPRHLRDWMFGGGGGPGFDDFMEVLTDQMGYDDGATSYDENKDFWKMVGVSKDDHDFMVQRSAG